MKRSIIKSTLIVIAAGCIGVFLSACTPPVPTPADIPTSTDAPTDVSPQAPTLPPSWTPGVAATVTPFSEGANAQTSAVTQEIDPATAIPTREGVPSLPPTWTPFRRPTVTPQPRAVNATFTPVPPTLTPAVSPTRNLVEGPLPVQPSEEFVNPECSKLTIFVDLYLYRSPTSAVTVGWTNIVADRYDLWVRNPEGRYTYRDFIPVPQGEQVAYYTIPAGVFLGIGQYTWEVYPVLNDYRMCPTVSGTIFISQRY